MVQTATPQTRTAEDLLQRAEQAARIVAADPHAAQEATHIATMIVLEDDRVETVATGVRHTPSRTLYVSDGFEGLEYRRQLGDYRYWQRLPTWSSARLTRAEALTLIAETVAE